jgi:hypothetical protein
LRRALCSGVSGRAEVIEQRELLHALGRLPHDREREIAAHRQPRQRKARRRIGEDARRNRIHARIARMVGDLDRPESPQRGDLLGIKPRRAVEPRDEDDGQRLGHHELPGRGKKLSHN